MTELDLSAATGLRVANVDALELRIANQTIWPTPAPPVGNPDYGPAVTITNTPTYVDSVAGFGKAWNNANTALMMGGPLEFTGSAWTVESWSTPTGALDTRSRLVLAAGSGAASAVQLGVTRATGGMKPLFTIGTLVYNYWSGFINMDERIHQMICKYPDGRVRFFLNGVQLMTSTGIATQLNWPAGFQLGAAIAFNSNNRYLGSIDEVRLSSVARRPDGATFTPPTSEYTVDSDTLALYHFNG